MTTPTPAQQLEEVRNAFKLAYSDVLQSHRLSGSEPTWDQCFDAGFAALMATPTLRRALAALDAVEGAEDCECGDCNGDGVWHLEPCGFCDGHGNFKMVPAPKTADAVEVSRG